MRNISFVLLILSISFSAIGQVERATESVFGLSAVVGVNASQVDGDNFTGYDKVGFVAGLKGITRLNDHFEAHVELLFSQKGSKFESEASSRQGTKDRAIHLNYAEIPIMLAYRTAPGINGGRMRLEAGIAVSRLLDANIDEPTIGSEREFDFENIKEDFNSTDFNVVIGGHVEFGNHIGIGLRYTGALSKFYENPNPVNSGSNTETVEFLRNYHLGAILTYQF